MKKKWTAEELKALPNARGFKTCNKFGCFNTHRNFKEGYCDEHLQYYRELQAERCREYRKTYDAKRNGDKYHRFYKTGAWEKLRDTFVLKKLGICEECGRAGDIAHHIIPIKINWDLRLSPSNLKCVCAECHELIHKELDKPTKQYYFID